MPNPFFPLLLVLGLGLSAQASTLPQAPFASPQLSQLEPLYAFVQTLEKAAGYLGVSEWMETTGLHLLLLPATQSAWKQKGLAVDKPFILQTPSRLACMGVADSKALAAAVEALPGEDKTTQKASLRFKVVRTGPTRSFMLFWSSTQLCLQPHVAAAKTATSPKQLEETLATTSAALKTAAQQPRPSLRANNNTLEVEPLSPQQLKLRLSLANLPWKIKTPQEGKTALASSSTESGVLLKVHGIPPEEVLRHTALMAALSPKGDALLAQKQAWFERLAPLLSEEFLLKIDYPQGRGTERFLLMAKIKADSEAAFKEWLEQMPKEAQAPSAVLSSKRGPLSLGSQGQWAFATNNTELALAHIEEVGKAKAERAPQLAALIFPKTLSAFFQGETLVSAMLGLSRKQIRMLMFNLPLKNLAQSLSHIKMETHLRPNHSAEMWVDIVLGP
ncbi:MAG: hypothetical protein FWG75_10545 [Cystobacterineae bacterium]|nr:hypothetical protein [Cystobacterineae bacterium]